MSENNTENNVTIPSAENETKTIMYKGRPLVRQGNFLFYGFPTDKVILALTILETEKIKDLEIATKVLVQIQKTDDSLSFNDRIVKSVEKKNFYDAFEIGAIWLDRELRTPGK